MPKWAIWLLLLVGAAVAVVYWFSQVRLGKAPGPPAPSTSGAPVILGVAFPKQIPADGSEALGTIRFRDAEGDLVLARFEVIRAQIFAPFEFDPEVKGQSESSFPFAILTILPQDVTLRVTLIDAQGHESEPVEFSFTAVASES